MAFKRSFRPRSKLFGGVSRIQRDTYSSPWSDGKGWYSLVNEIAKRDDICFICGKPILPGEKWETHHIQKLTRGGVTNKANLARIHASCHDTRHPHLHKKRAYLR